VAEERQPRWASRTRFRPVMNAEDTANHIFVDCNAESRRELLGDAATAPVEIAPFQFDDCLDEFFLRSFRARRTPALARKQHAVLSFGQHVVEGSSLDGFRTMAERRTRAGFMKRVHKPAMIRSVTRRLGARLRPRLRMRS